MANEKSIFGMVISAGCIHGEIAGEYCYIGQARGGKVVKFNKALNLTEEQKQTVSAFVAKAKEN